MDRVTVIGGGLTGLTAAFLAAKNGFDVTLFEESAEFGGLAKTFSLASTHLEQFYHHFFTHDSELFWLLKELKISDKLEFKKTTMGVFKDNRLYKFSGIIDLIKYSPMGLTDKVRFLATSLYLSKCRDWQRWDDTPAIDWFYKYAGKRTTDSLWKPMLQIKFGEYYNVIPLAWIIGRLRQRVGSRKITGEQLGYIRGSLNLLISTLLDKLKDIGVKLKPEQKVEELLIKNNELVGIRTNKEELVGGIFLSTLPTVELVPLLQCSPAFSRELSNIKYLGALCVILELDHSLTDIYWLNVADGGFPFGGIIEHTNFIDRDNYNGNYIVYLSRYFGQDDPLKIEKGEKIAEDMISHLKKINPEFDKSWIKNTHFFRSNSAAPLCTKGFSKIVPAYKSPIKNLYLANMVQIYPDERSCNNSVRVALRACREMGITGRKKRKKADGGTHLVDISGEFLSPSS